MLVSTSPPASSAGSDEAKRSRCGFSVRYSGLIPSRSRPRVSTPVSRSATANANMPRKWSTQSVPQRWNALSSTSVSEVEKNR